MDQITDLFPSGDKDELFSALDSREYWLLLMVDMLPVAAIVNALARCMPDPPKIFAVKGLPPVIALPKADFDAEKLAGIMSTAAPGQPLPPELLKRALGGKDMIMCAEPQSINLGIAAMERFIKMHKEWKVERFGIQLFTVTHRLYQDDYKEAIDFLMWMMAGIVCQTGALKPRTDIDVVTSVTDTIHQATIGGKEKAAATIESLKKSARFLEPAMKILDTVIQDKSNRSRAISVLRMWIKKDVDPNDCALWVASNIGLYMTNYDCDDGMLQTVAEQMLLRIRDKSYALEILKKRTVFEGIDKEIEKAKEEVKADFMKSLDDLAKIEEEQIKPPKRR